MNFKRFEFKEHTADVLIVAYGRSLEELFENAAVAVFEVMTDTSRIEPKLEYSVEEEGIDYESLLLRWLESFLVYYDADNVVFGKFKVDKIWCRNEECYIKGKGWGEEFDENKHEKRTIVKAITYAEMKIEKKNGLWTATFVVDI